jgi:hypothetical protein
MISEEIENIIGSIPAFRRIALCFRVDPQDIEITNQTGGSKHPEKDNPEDEIDDTLAKAVWFIVPFHVFIISRIYHGDIGLMIVFALLSLLFVIVYGNIVAMLDFRSRNSYDTKARQWSIVCILLWASTLVFLSLGFLIAWPLKSGHLDIIGFLISIPSGSAIPDVNLETILTYVVYSGIALLVLRGIARKFGNSKGGEVSSRSVTFSIILVMLNTLILFGSAIAFRVPG